LPTPWTGLFSWQSYDGSEPILIVGLLRSGSTFMEFTLASHRLEESVLEIKLMTQ
jgi:hypothetical protein